MLVNKDRVKESTVTTGTGSYTLAGALNGFQSFAAVGDGNTCYYSATDGTNWESGIGTYTLAGTVLARTTVLESSNGGAAVDWGAGTKLVSLSPPASKFRSVDQLDDTGSFALVNKGGSNQTIASAAATKLTWPTEELDVGSEFASDKFTVARSGTYTFNLAVHFAAIGTGTTEAKVMLYKNGALRKTLRQIITLTATLTDITLGGSFTDACAATDFYEAYVQLVGYTSGTATVDGAATETWFSAVRVNGSNPVESILLAASDETTLISVRIGYVTFRMPYAFTLTEVRASLTTAQGASGAGGIFTLDVMQNGSTIFTTKPTLDNTEKTTQTAATPSVLLVTALASDDEMRVDVTQIGDGTAAGLKVALIGRRT